MMQSRRIIIIACINTVYKAQITQHRKYETKWNIAIANCQGKINKSRKKLHTSLTGHFHAVGKLCCGEKKHTLFETVVRPLGP